MWTRFWAVFAVALALSGCSHGGDAPVGSLLVMRHGRIVREHYSGGLRATDRVPVFSVTKSVTSALVGIAIARGELTLDERLPWNRQVTVRQLLSMTAGYAPGSTYQSADPQTLASRARVNTPGTFSYDSGSYDLLGDLLERASGMPLPSYARAHLFDPMGIHDVRWPGGRGASGLLLRPRDVLAFGALYLKGGRGIVPADWVRRSTRGRTYGYGWWIRPHAYAAYGYLGQSLTISPRRDEVVLVTSSRE
jgi:CubicO group peptidase (beta-lactamase class C family)